ncbi:MAG TPA: hypothetical protein VLX92_23135 [Kofleriaceae bacterium]|nr:hypothetical protein [Kofleriaceae bacterium]
MARLYDKLAVCLFVALAAAPVAARLARVRDHALNGAFTPVALPTPSAASVRDESFQQGFKAWFEATLGLRGYAVVADNTLLYHAFHDTKSGSPVRLGRDGVLFIDEDLNYFNRDTLLFDPAKLEALATRIAAIQRALAARHRAFIPLIIPSKTTVYRDAVAARWSRDLGEPRVSDLRLYLEMKRALDAHHVVYVDGRELLAGLHAPRDELWGKSARHWSEYSACRALEQVAARYRELTGVALDYDCTALTVPGIASHEDYDLLRLLNTLWVPHEHLVTTATHSTPPPDAPKPSVMFVGTSFCWSLLHDARHSRRFGRSRMAYYDRTLIHDREDDQTPIEPHTAEWRAEFLDIDIYVLDLFETYLAPGDSYVDHFTAELGTELGVP